PVPLRIDGEPQEEGHTAHKLLTSLGYQLNTDLPSYTYQHPVQTLIPLRDENGELIPGKQLLKKCEKGVRYSVRVGESRGLDCETYSFEDVQNDPALLDAFVSVMDDTSERNDFVHRDNSYLMLLFETLKDYTDIMIVYYDKAKDTALQNARLKEREQKEAALETAPQKKIKGLKNDIDVIDKNTKSYNERMEETKDYPAEARIPVAGGLTIRYGGFANCVFGGTRNIVRNNTRSSHYMNYLRLLRSIDLGMDYHDLGYVLCDSPETMEADGSLGPLSPNEDFVGISKFKLSFGARYTEYIGEYILVGNAFRYWLYKELMPKAKKAKMTVVRLLKNR
ncbi:MAG: peptidoglycan bridge formation glycyltransferase FemA/FemB family protein, partial [Clostridia bacterium]|nr:peptidoglycan bridge formation glycyltransferase FemA/FemB family protein [Clostridia bacterium]